MDGTKDLETAKEYLKEYSAASGVQEMASSQIKLMTGYYNNVLNQSQRNFNFALVAAGIGLLFFIAAGNFILTSDLKSLALITTFGGALSTFVSGVLFYIYNKDLSQLADFHKQLNETQRFFLSKGIIQSLDRLSNAETGDVQEIAATQMEILSAYYSAGIEQSNRSFRSASIAAGAGLVFFIIVIAYSIWKPQENIVSIATLGTALSGFISGICFYLYNKSTSQLSGFHEKLYMIQRYLLANSMCERLDGKNKDETRSAIIKQLANVPMPESHTTPETQ